MKVKMCAVPCTCSSILIKARCVDAEWQPKRCKSWGQQRSSTLMAVAEMKGGSWEESFTSWAMWLHDVQCVFPMSAIWKISPGKQEGYWGKRKRGCCAQWEGGIVYAFLCVSGDGRDTVHSSGIRGLMKKNINVWLRSDWDGERGYLTPGWEQRSARPNLQFWTATLGLEIGFPWLQQVAVMEVASVICRFWRRQCLEAPWERSEIQSCVSLLSSPGETQTLRSERGNKEWQKWNIMNACRNLKVPAFSFSGTGVGSARGECLDTRVDFRLNKRLWRGISGTWICLERFCLHHSFGTGRWRSDFKSMTFIQSHTV